MIGYYILFLQAAVLLCLLCLREGELAWYNYYCIRSGSGACWVSIGLVNKRWYAKDGLDWSV